MNVTSVGLNGVIELLVPSLLFLYFSRNFAQQRIRLGGVSADLSTWRRITWGVVVLVCALIIAAYVLNICVKTGVYGPLRKARHASEEEDYSHYAAYDDLSAPPAPPGVMAPASAPAAAPSAAAAAAAAAVVIG